MGAAASTTCRAHAVSLDAGAAVASRTEIQSVFILPRASPATGGVG
jgi:hypothetical protein